LGIDHAFIGKARVNWDAIAFTVLSVYATAISGEVQLGGLADMDMNPFAERILTGVFELGVNGEDP
jgi:hypothetical protein